MIRSDPLPTWPKGTTSPAGAHPRSSARTRCGLLLFAFTLIAQMIASSDAGLAQSAPESPSTAPIVYLIPIHGTIEPGIGHFLERSLDEAADAGATLVVLDLNTPGGRLDTVLEMRTAILESPVRTVAFVNREAFSAGALITIASNEIWMAPGAVYGAATPVIGGAGETASEKTVSAVRSVFRATAEERGRDPIVAEAMVDPAVVVDGLDSSTSLLTLTTDQALQWGYADGVADDLPALLAELGLANAAITEMSVSPIEQLVRWITDPLFASLLITMGLFLIIADALFAGFGIAAGAGVLCFGLFFWGHLLAGFAGWEDLLLIVIGLALIALEIFVIPGFGWAGISGAIALGAGLFFAMVDRDFGEVEWTGDVIRAGWVIAGSLALTIIGLIAVSLIMPKVAPDAAGRARGFSRLALSATVDAGGAPQRTAETGWLTRRLGGSGVLERDDVQRQLPQGHEMAKGKSPPIGKEPD